MVSYSHMKDLFSLKSGCATVTVGSCHLPKATQLVSSRVRKNTHVRLNPKSMLFPPWLVFRFKNLPSVYVLFTSLIIWVQCDCCNYLSMARKVFV